MLHPRDRHGRFRKKWKMAAGVVDALTGFLDRFSPHTFQSDQQASQYAFNRRKTPWSTPELQRLHTDWDDANESLQAGEMDDTTKKFVEMMDRNMVETTDDLIVSQTVPPEAFGMSAQQAQLEDGGLEDFIGLEIADAGYAAMNLGSELSHPPGSITMRVAVPKGTRAAMGGRSPNDRQMFLDRDQPLVITKVEPDGRGGWYMLAIAGSGRKTKGASAVADDRTFGRRGSGLTPEQREARVTPRMSGEQRLQTAQQNAREMEGGVVPAQPQAPGAAPTQAPAPAAPASPQTPAPPAVGVPERREPVHKESIGPGSPEGKSPSDIATDAEAARVQAENAPPAPAAPRTPAEFRAATRGIPSPSAGKRRVQWNKAHQGVVTGKRDPEDVLRELDTDIADAKVSQTRIAEGKDPADPALDSDIESMEKLADAISEHSGAPRRGQTTAPTSTPEAPAAPAKAAKATAKKAGPAPTPGAPSTTKEATPKAPAPKKAAKRAPQEIADQFKSVQNREEGDALLEGLTGPELRAVAEAANITVPKRGTKDQMKRLISQGGYGRRLDSDAIGRANIDTPAKRAADRDQEDRVIAKAKAIRGRKAEADFDDEDRRIVGIADRALKGRQDEENRRGIEKRISGEETRSEMRERTAGGSPRLTDEQKADIKAKSDRTNARMDKERADEAAKDKADLDPLLEAAGLQEDDLDDLDKTGAALILGQVRDKKMSKAEGVRRLKASKSPRLKALGDALAAQPRKTAAKKAPAKKAVPTVEESRDLSDLSDAERRGYQKFRRSGQSHEDAMQSARDEANAKVTAPPVKAVAKKAVPAKAAPTPVDAEEEAFKARVAEAGLPDRVTALRDLAREQKIRGFSTMNKKQLQSALLGDEVPRAGKIGVVTPKKLVPHIQAAKSDQEARGLLESHTLADLRAMAKDPEVGVTLPSRGVTKDKAKDAILEAIRGGPEGGLGETPARSLRQELDAQKWVEPTDPDVARQVRGIIEDTDDMDAADLRTGRDALEAVAKSTRSGGNRQDANLAQTAADTMGMRAQVISGVEEGPARAPVKRVAKKAVPEVDADVDADVEPEPKTLDKMLKPELEALAAKEGVPGVRKSMTKPQLKEAIERNRRMDSSRGGETEEERLRRELEPLPGGAERDLGPNQGPLRLPDRAPTAEEIAQDNPEAPATPAKAVRKRVPKKVAQDTADKAAAAVSEQVKGTFGEQLRQEDPESVRQAARAVGIEAEGNTSEEIFDNTLKQMIEGRMRELGMLPEDPKKPTRAQKRVPKGSVAGPKADTPIETPGRALSFTDAWNDNGFAGRSDAAMDEIRDDVSSGKLTPEEGIRRMETEIAFNKDDLADTEAKLRDRSITKQERADLVEERRRLKQSIEANTDASSFMRQYFKNEAPVTREELEVKLDPAEKAALDRVDVDSLKEAARQEGLGDIEGDDKDTVVQNIAKKVQAREASNREKEQTARDIQAEKDKKRTSAEAIAGIEQVMGGTDRAVTARIKSQSKVSGLSAEDQKDLLDNAGDREGLQKVLDRIARENGLFRIATRGANSHFDPETHEQPPGANLQKGDPITVLETGWRSDVRGVDMRIRKAKVTEGHSPVVESLAPEAPAKKAAKAARPGPISPAEVMGQLSNIENPPSREESKALLDRLNGRDIRPMAKELHIPTSGKTNDQIRDEIIEATSGRLADAKVSRGFGGTTPTSVPVRTGETTTEAFERTRVAQVAKKAVAAKAAVPAKAAPKAVDLDNPTRHNAELIGTGLDLDPDGQDKGWLREVQRDLDGGTDGRQIADALRRAADSQRTIHNIQEASGGTAGASPEARINRMELMADRLEGVRPLKAAAPAPVKAVTKATKKAAPAKKAGTSARDDAVATGLMDRIRERDPAVADAVLAEISPEDRKELDAARERDTARRVAKAAAPKKRTAAEMRRARSASESEGVPVEQILERWDGQKQDRKNLTGPVGEMVAQMIDDAVQRATGAPDELQASHELQTLPHSEMRTLADRVGVSRTGTKAQLGQRIAARMRGTEAPTTSAERAVPKAEAPSAGAVNESVPMQPYSKSDNMRMHVDSPTMGLVKAYEAAGRNGSANEMLDLRRRATEKRGSTTPQQVVDELKAMRARETDPKFQRELDRAISANDSPMTPTPDLPANTPPAARDLIERLHAIPYARKGTGEDAAIGTVSGDSLVNQVADVLRQLASGDLRQQPDMRLRQILTQKVHEMNEPSFRIWELADLLEPVTDAQGRRRPSPLTLALREMRPK